MHIKAIETVYKGYRFRSRLEARWAVYFDNAYGNGHGLKWVYEKEGFDLGNGIRYLPDFWLLSGRMWAEIKPDDFSDSEFEKCWRLATQTGRPIAMLVGVPGERNHYKMFDPKENKLFESGGFFISPMGISEARAARFEHGEMPA